MVNLYTTVKAYRNLVMSLPPQFPCIFVMFLLYVLLCFATDVFARFCYVLLWFAMFCYAFAMLCYVTAMFCYVLQCFAMFCYTLLCFRYVFASAPRPVLCAAHLVLPLSLVSGWLAVGKTTKAHEATAGGPRGP